MVVIVTFLIPLHPLIRMSLRWVFRIYLHLMYLHLVHLHLRVSSVIAELATVCWRVLVNFAISISLLHFWRENLRLQQLVHVYYIPPGIIYHVLQSEHLEKSWYYLPFSVLSCLKLFNWCWLYIQWEHFAGQFFERLSYMELDFMHAVVILSIDLGLGIGV